MQEEKEVEMEDVDEESSDSDLDDYEEVEASEEEMTLITQLEEELETNPNLYEKHIQYIALLRKSKMKSRLHTARKAMQTRFPLAEPLWLEWLEDEQAGLRSSDDTRAVESLFELAVQDYASVDIWLQYLNFLAKHDAEVKIGSTAGKEKIGSVGERALTAAGLHLSEGGKVWQAFRDLEARHAGDMDSKDPQHPATKLLHRQLQVPLQNGEQTLTDAGLSIEDLPESVRQGYDKAQAMVQVRAAHEAAVASTKPADTELLAAYMAYIQLEESSGMPARVQCIYERALAKFPVTHALWLQYALYLEQHLNIPAVVNQVYARAVRNCPWVGALWSRALRALERGGAPDAEHAALHAAALVAGMESPEDYMAVSLARLDCLRRQGAGSMEALRAAFQAATELMAAYFPDYLDRSLRLPAYWATCEQQIAGDGDAACQVWEATLRTPLGMYAEAILAYVALQVSAKRFKEARSVFRKYHRRQLHERGGPAVCEAWLRFEREYGSAEDHFQALVKAESVLSQDAATAAEAADPQLAADAEAAAKSAPQLSKADLKRMRQEKDPNFKAKAERTPRESQPKRKKGLGFEDAKDAKRPKNSDQKESAPSSGPTEFTSTGRQDVNTIDAPESSSSPAATAAAVAAAAGPSTVLAGEAGPSTSASPSGKMGPPPPRSMGPPPARPAQAPNGPQQQTQAQPHVGQQQRKAFIKGISPAAGKAELEALLGACGTVVDFSMPHDRSSQPPRHRGFAYVTFSSPDGLRNALALDASELQGQPISVAVAHQEVQEDQRTAFVLNVAPSTDSALLEALFAQCGTVKSLRLPLDRETSQPRGFAYVEFETEAGLQHAVDMTGIELDGKHLRISVATPPGGGGGRGRGRGRGPPGHGRGRGPPGRGRGGGLENGGGPAGGGRAGRGYLDLGRGGSVAFRPRSVGRGGAPKSNDDFRAMLR